MKETIEAWAVVDSDGNYYLTRCREHAEEKAKEYGGTVVRLTGEIPRPLRKVVTEVWIKPREPDKDSMILERRLGIKYWDMDKSKECPIRARITMEELPEEGKQ